MSEFSGISTLVDVKNAIGSIVKAADKSGRRLVILTTVLCAAPLAQREALGFRPKDGVVTLSNLRKYFRDTYGTDGKDDTARQLIQRATATGFAVAETMPSLAGLNSFENACNMAAQHYREWSEDRKAKADADKADAATKRAADAQAAAAAKSEAAAIVQETEINLTSEDGTVQSMSIADFVRVLYDAGDVKALHALSHAAAASAAALEIHMQHAEAI